MDNNQLAKLLIAAANALLQQEPVGATPVLPDNTERWILSRNAKGRVPKFVQDMTGLRTKYEIISRYGHGAVFDKSGPLPPGV